MVSRAAGDVPIRLGQKVVAAAPSGERVKVRLDDGSERTVDHILLGTGYHVDISKYEFMTPELLQTILRWKGYPRLKEGLETSVPGLHIVGSPAAWSFGPIDAVRVRYPVRIARTAQLYCRTSAAVKVERSLSMTVDLEKAHNMQTAVIDCPQASVGAVVVGGDYRGPWHCAKPWSPQYTGLHY